MDEIIRFTHPPWDWVAFPGAPPAPPVGVGGVRVGEIGVYIGSDEPTAEQIEDGVAIVVRVRTGFGFYDRVAEWTLDGGLTVVTGTGTYEGHVHLVVPAINYVDGGPILPVALGGPALHGGWFGRDESPAPWKLDGADFDPGPCEFRFGDVTGLPASDFIDGGIAFAPLFGFSNLPIVVGRLRPEDNCIVTCSLPATIDGSFDGYGDHGFTFRLGTVADVIIGGPPPSITGALTFNPTLMIDY